jgi:predicted TIM-barrel fold metal-dependent hydrolase
VSETSNAAAPTQPRIINCHTHTFTQAQTPRHFLPWPVPELVRLPWVRWLLYQVARIFDPNREGALGRYAEIVSTSYGKGQDAVFDIVKNFYPVGTRFVVLPMDMTCMNAGRVDSPITEQHEELARLRDSPLGRDLVIPFAAVDPRHNKPGEFDIVAETIKLLEAGFWGIKLYPPTGYHPYDERLHDLYVYASQNNVPVLSHCSRPASVQYRGEPTAPMRDDPEHPGARLNYDRFDRLTYFTRPDAYLPILEQWANIPVCLAHFGGAGDWGDYIRQPWKPQTDPLLVNWLGRILELLRSEQYNLWTDISYTLFADDDFVYLLKVLLEDKRVLERVMFGSDFYVVENARLEERRRALRIRAVLGEDTFRQIAEVNPANFLGNRCMAAFP